MNEGLSVRIILEKPPTGVDFGIQKVVVINMKQS
jgi:hypothetical protein